MKKESYVRDQDGRTIGKNVTWTKAGVTHVYKTYDGTKTAKEHIGDIIHKGDRSIWRKK